MKSKTILGVLLLGLSGYMLFTQYFMGGEKPEENPSAKSAFGAFGKAVSNNDTTAALAYVSKSFSFKKISKNDFVAILRRKRTQYLTKNITIKTSGRFALISYMRVEKYEGAKQSITNIKGERWINEQDGSGWKLHMLAKTDPWLSGGKANKIVEQESRAPDHLKEARESGQVRRAMRPGEVYSSRGRRNPFRSLIAGEPGALGDGSEKCDPDRPREFLEEVDLRSLKFSGVVSIGQGMLALVQAPDGKGYSVNVGMYLGRNCGKVVDITAGEIEIMEKIQKPGDLAGSFNPAKSYLKLRPEEE